MPNIIMLHNFYFDIEYIGQTLMPSIMKLKIQCDKCLLWFSTFLTGNESEI